MPGKAIFKVLILFINIALHGVYGVHVEARGQLCGVRSHLPPLPGFLGISPRLPGLCSKCPTYRTVLPSGPFNYFLPVSKSDLNIQRLVCTHSYPYLVKCVVLVKFHCTLWTVICLLVQVKLKDRHVTS